MGNELDISKNKNTELDKEFSNFDVDLIFNSLSNKNKSRDKSWSMDNSINNNYNNYSKNNKIIKDKSILNFGNDDNNINEAWEFTEKITNEIIMKKININLNTFSFYLNNIKTNIKDVKNTEIQYIINKEVKIIKKINENKISINSKNSKSRNNDFSSSSNNSIIKNKKYSTLMEENRPHDIFSFGNHVPNSINEEAINIKKNNYNTIREDTETETEKFESCKNKSIKHNIDESFDNYLEEMSKKNKKNKQSYLMKSSEDEEIDIFKKKNQNKPNKRITSNTFFNKDRIIKNNKNINPQAKINKITKKFKNLKSNNDLHSKYKKNTFVESPKIHQINLSNKFTQSNKNILNKKLNSKKYHNLIKNSSKGSLKGKNIFSSKDNIKLKPTNSKLSIKKKKSKAKPAIFQQIIQKNQWINLIVKNKNNRLNTMDNNNDFLYEEQVFKNALNSNDDEKKFNYNSSNDDQY